MGIGLAIPIGQGAIRGSYAVADDIDGLGECLGFVKGVEDSASHRS